MRTAAILLLICLGTTVFATESTMTEKVGALLQMTARASDAVDGALQVLYDLRQANYDAQSAADEQNKTQQAACDSEIADLLSIADTNKASGDASTAHRKYIDTEINDTLAYLEWIKNRRIEIDRQQIELQDQRCYSNGIFVRALKEHSDSLKVIDILRSDVLPAANKGEVTDLAQIRDASKKLSMYKHLFNEQALKEFNQLADMDNNDTWNDAADDNQKAGLQLVKEANNIASRGILGGGLNEQILTLLDNLEAHLEESISQLEAAEVKSAWDLATWLQDSEAEKVNLDQEEEKKNTYLDKIRITIQAARAHENKAWEIYFQSAAAYNNAVRACIAKGEAYMADQHKRDDENGLLDDVIRIFKDKVSGLGADVRSNQISRRMDTSDLGQVASNLGL